MTAESPCAKGVSEVQATYPERDQQLYNLAADPGETKNLASEMSELVTSLTEGMDKLVNDGRSTPGPTQTNDVSVKWKRFLNSEKVGELVK